MYRLHVRNFMPWGCDVRALCQNVPQVEGEELYAIGSSCDRAMSKCAIG